MRGVIRVKRDRHNPREASTGWSLHPAAIPRSHLPSRRYITARTTCSHPPHRENQSLFFPAGGRGLSFLLSNAPGLLLLQLELAFYKWCLFAWPFQIFSLDNCSGCSVPHLIPVLLPIWQMLNIGWYSNWDSHTFIHAFIHEFMPYMCSECLSVPVTHCPRSWKQRGDAPAWQSPIWIREPERKQIFEKVNK